MRTRRYDPYRGRGRGHTFLKVLIVILLIVLILAVAAFFVLDHYVVVSADGYRITLPFLNREEELETVSPSPSPSEGGLPLVIESKPPQVPALPDGNAPFRGVFVPRTALRDGSAAAEAEKWGATAVIFDMKDDLGTLGYRSEQRLGGMKGVSAVDPEINDAIRALNEDGLYTVARVSCFRDNKAPYFDNTTALRSYVGNWRDPQNVRWLNPARSGARDYVVGVCAELAELGFDEIVLDHAGYPVSGSLDSISHDEYYDPEALSAPVEEFFTQLAQTLEEYPEVRLSVVTDAAVLGGAADRSGLTQTLLEQYADRVWVCAPEDGSALPDTDGFRLPVVPMSPDPMENQNSWVLTQPGEKK